MFHVYKWWIDCLIRKTENSQFALHLNVTWKCASPYAYSRYTSFYQTESKGYSINVTFIFLHHFFGIWRNTTDYMTPWISRDIFVIYYPHVSLFSIVNSVPQLNNQPLEKTRHCCNQLHFSVLVSIHKNTYCSMPYYLN